jgi:TRAP-type mannitol/chloroaromatic compound transport system permease small subunit
MHTKTHALERFGQNLMQLSAWPGRISSWLILPIILSVLVGVVGGLMRLGELFGWGFSIPLLGSRLTMASLTELEWHLLGVIVMFGAAFTMVEERHVRVDLIYANLSDRKKVILDVLGDVFLLLPFCAIIFWLSLGFVDMAFRSGEKSDYGGLTDRYLAKAVIPIGLALLFACGLGRIIRNIGFLLSGRAQQRVDNSSTTT